MSPTVGDTLTELRRLIDGSIQKTAEQRLAEGNVLEGNRHATDGAGGTVSEEQKKGPVDQTHPQIEQTDPGTKSTDYQIATDSKETSVKDESISADPPEKMAQLANMLVTEMNQLLNNSGNGRATLSKQAAQEQGRTAARATITQLLKEAAEDETEEEEDSSSEEDKEEDEKIDLEKLSSAQQADWNDHYKAGAQACREWVSEMQKQSMAQLTPQQYEYLQGYQQGQELAKQAAARGELKPIQKQAAALTEQHVLQQRLIGYRLAQEEMKKAEAMQKQAEEAARAQQNFLQHTVKSALDSAVREAEEQEKMARAQTTLQRLESFAKKLEGGTPHPFVLKAGALVDQQVHPILSGLLADGTISDEEKQAVLDYLASAERLNEQSIDKAVEPLENSSIVAERLKRNILQQNAHAVPAPAPAMPLSQGSPSAMEASYTGAVSQTPLPGSVEEREDGTKLVTAAVKAAVKDALRELSGRKE